MFGTEGKLRDRPVLSSSVESLEPFRFPNLDSAPDRFSGSDLEPSTFEFSFFGGRELTDFTDVAKPVGLSFGGIGGLEEE